MSSIKKNEMTNEKSKIPKVDTSKEIEKTKEVTTTTISCRIKSIIDNQILLTQLVLIVSLILRIAFFLFGLYQDATMEVKYTDIDYYVFTDAARYIQKYGMSPYSRETYRYTPLLAYMLIPTAYKTKPRNEIIDEFLYFSFGKYIFIFSDLIAGYLILKVLNFMNGNFKRNLLLVSIWLLNPMVITISTRGSSESFLGIMVMFYVYFLVVKNNYLISGFFLGLSIHFKLYPVIYMPASVLFILLREKADIIQKQFNQKIKDNKVSKKEKIVVQQSILSVSDLFKFFTNFSALKFVSSAIITFIGLGYMMYMKFGDDFIYNSYLYHFIRTDHRHNFSIYNQSLYFLSSIKSLDYNFQDLSNWENDLLSRLLEIDYTKFAFLPQIFISGVFIPLSIFLFRNTSASPSSLLTCCIFLQTFAFVNYNKVITSQYFLWYLLLLPFQLQNSPVNVKTGISMLVLWVFGQALWLFSAYKLEFLGVSQFYPQLYLSSCVFFLINTWILRAFIDAVRY